MKPTLRKHDWLRLQDCLLDLHGAPSLAELPTRLLACVRRVIPCETATVQDDRGSARRVPWLFADQPWRPSAAEDLGVRMMVRWEHNFFDLREPFFAFSAERHPHTEHFRRTGDGSARRLTDVVPLNTLRRTCFYNEISRPHDVRRQLTVYAPLPGGGTLMLAVARTGADFSELDRTRLEILRPHVALAWTRALERLRQEAALQGLRRVTPSVENDPVAGARTLRGRVGLTPREAETLFWVAQGKTNAEIGIILDLAPATVKGYVERLLARLNCPTRTAAARTALEALA